jgi:flagellum-specific peptidoglycan hydrolase FlgJ
MKIINLIIFLLFIGNICQSQILKKVLNDAKNQAEWKVRSKAMQKTDQAIDSLLTKPQKEKESKQEKKDKNAETNPTTNSQNDSGQDQMQMKEGHVTVALSSDQAFGNDLVRVRGSSVKYGNLKEVTLSISGPILENKTVYLNDNNIFDTALQFEQPGSYNITVTSSDGKAIENVELTVKDDMLGDWTEDNRQEVAQAYQLVIKHVDRVKSIVTQKEKVEIEKKMELLKKDVEKLNDFLDELSKARKQLANRKLHLRLEQNISRLNDALYQHRIQMKQLREAADHEPFDNTICEYITMVKEAALAFDMLTSWVKIPLEILYKS